MMIAVSGPTAYQRTPKPNDDSSRASATTVWAVAMPLARTLCFTSRPARAAMTPSVAA